jgi:hypothetical protein
MIRPFDQRACPRRRRRPFLVARDVRCAIGKAHRELEQPALFAQVVGHGDGLGLHQIRLVEPGHLADVAQQLGHPFVGLRHAGHHELVTGLLEAGQVDAFRHLTHKFLEQLHRQVSLRLQALDRTLAIQQCLDVLLQRVDPADRRIHAGVFRLQHLIACRDGIDLRVDIETADQNHERPAPAAPPSIV